MTPAMSEDLMLMAMIALATMAMMLLGYVIWQGVAGSERRLRRRIAAVRGERQMQVQTLASVRRDDGEGKGHPMLQALSQMMPRRENLKLRLSASGIRLTPVGYLVASVIVATGMLLFLIFWAGLAVPLAVPGAVAAGFGLPHAVVGFLISRRRSKFAARFPDAIDLIVRSLKSGLPVTEAMMAVAREMDDPIGTEFRKVCDAVRLGKPLEKALWSMADRLESTEVKFFVISLSIQQETGGNLAETLDNLSDIIRRRRQMKLKVAAMSSEAKASAIIIGSLPFAMFTILYVINPDYVTLLLTDVRGVIMTGVGLSMVAMGVAVMTKMVRFEI
ncbi:MAG: type II secretion system F family protein [Rhodospirillales bacterium]